MGNLTTSLINTANALRVYAGALDVTQNNVTNADTPGFVKQRANLEAQPFDLTTGTAGGVVLGPAQNSRNQFAEQSVREQQAATEYYQQKVADISTAQNYFSLSGTSGIAPAMSSLFQSFSQLTVTPNDTVARQTILNNAGTVAQNFHDTVTGLLKQTDDLHQQINSTIGSINQIANIIAGINTQSRVDPSGSVDAGVDAQLNSSLEQLAQYVNFSTLQQPDGTVSVYVGGQTPLVIGDQVYAIQGDFSSPQTAILSAAGADITAQLTGGQLGAELDDNNNVIPSYINDLNRLAQTLADEVNNALNSGIDQNGAAPVTDLFSYDATNGAAATLAVNPLTPDQIAAATPGAPGGNGNALSLAALENSPVVNGYTFADFYGNLGGRVGSDLSAAQSTGATKQSLLSQAQSLRQQVSGVSLDEEAENLLQYQRAYDAISKMVGVLNTLSQTVINLLPPIT
jgi:flagellar hook-associated protein 1